MKKRIISLLCVMAMLFALMCGAVYAADDIVLIGEAISVDAGWQTVAQINSTNWGGTVAPDFIAEGGKLTVIVSGENVWSVHVVMQGNTNGWAQVDKESPTFTDNGDGTYAAVFTYEDLANGYGAVPSDVNAYYVYANSESGATVHSAVWSAGEAAPEEPEVTEPEVTEPEVTEPEVTEPEVTEPEVTEPEVTEPEATEPEVEKGYPRGQNIFGKTVTTDKAWDADSACVYTNIWGGEFDNARVKSGGTFYITYKGEKGKIMLALNGNGWQQLEPSSTKAYADGWVSSFSYSDCAAAYGSDFSTLGAVHAFTMDSVPMTITGIYWYAPGDPNNPETGVLLPVAAAIVGTASVLGLGITIHKRKELN